MTPREQIRQWTTDIMSAAMAGKVKMSGDTGLVLRLMQTDVLIRVRKKF